MRWFQFGHICFLFIGTVVVGGCRGEDSQRTPGVISRDSAGIAIIENTAPQWGQGEGWRIEPEPILRIGAVDGPVEYVLHQVIGAVRLSDGSLAVAQFASGDVRVFDAGGVYRRTIGRRGLGPDEFQSVQLVPMTGDSVLAFDFLAQRVSLLDPVKGVARSVALNAEAGLVGIRGFLGDGAALGIRDGHQSDADIIELVRLDIGTGKFNEVGRLPARSPEFPRPLSLGSFVAPHRDGFWFGVGSEFEVLQYSSAGTPQKVIRWAGTPQVISDDAESRLMSQFANVHFEGTRQIPSHHPRYQTGLADDTGNLWLVSWTVDEPEVQSWTVFDLEGRWLGAVAIPANWYPYQISEDFIVLYGHDALQVEYIQVHRINK
jgi:hypothetical protein